jgi:transcriptional regulator with XRE-family HTH domain
MTLMPDIALPAGIVPEVQIHHRLAIALEVTGLSTSRVATALSVHRNTVSNWVHGHIEPRPRDVLAIAQLTGIDAEWLFTGEAHKGGPNGGVRSKYCAPLLLAA